MNTSSVCVFKCECAFYRPHLYYPLTVIQLPLSWPVQTWNVPLFLLCSSIL